MTHNLKAVLLFCHRSPFTIINRSEHGMVSIKHEALRIENVSKEFENQKVLENVNLNLFQREILGLAGENGAGKSTLLKLLSGIYKKDDGRIYIDERPATIDSISSAYKENIVSVQQDSELFLDMTVADNLFLGFQNKYKKVFFNRRNNERLSAEVLKKYSINMLPKQKLNELTMADREVLEVVKAVISGAKILLMDEPTASLSWEEMNKVHDIVKELKNIGKSIIYISQNIDELISLCDRIAVIRNKTVAWVFKKRDFNKDKIITMMVGREIPKFENSSKEISGNTVLQVNNLSGFDKVHNVSFTLRQGEILGIAGLRGTGKTELLKLIFGAAKKVSGKIVFRNRELPYKNPNQSISNRIAFVPSERIEEAMFLSLNGSDNMRLDNIKGTLRLGFINKRLQNFIFTVLGKKLNIMRNAGHMHAKKLSGGVQQKLVLARAMAVKPELLLLDEPTKAIDVNAKNEIYREMHELTSQGTSIITTFSEIREMLSICDRILIMNNGTIITELQKEDFSEETLISKMTYEVHHEREDYNWLTKQ